MPVPIVEISFSKKKYSIFFIVFGILFLLGIFLLVDPLLSSPTFSKTFWKTIGIISILVCGFGAYIMARKILETKIAMTISNEGIFDNFSKPSYGFIAWKDIEEIKKRKTHEQKFLLFFVNNPTFYLDKFNHPKHQKILSNYQEHFSTPICIAPKSLNCTFDELHGLILRRFNLYKKNKLHV